ncbi:hypothetical protein AC230_21335 [Streptomyces caatingaensis]|uniref:Pesticidal crystal protein domain-containing protein n=1 Tax=Streptomyces caatingaensis TaxID=1678637 RepID=A0A0K9XAQ4_9ACTN|nr:hypothetical protein AC230_21335 [Streptomyces caatingaensis]
MANGSAKVDVARLTQAMRAMLDASAKGVKLDYDDPWKIAEYALSILYSMMGFFPGGTQLVGICQIVTSLFWPNGAQRMWEKQLEIISKLIDARIEQKEITDQASLIVGMKDGLNEYAAAVNALQNNPTDTGAKERVRTYFRSAYGDVVQRIPSFQKQGYETVSIFNFALAANMRLLMLADAVKYGHKWDLPGDEISHYRNEFNRLVGRSSTEVTHEENRRHLGRLEESIKAAPELGLSARGVSALTKERDRIRDQRNAPQHTSQGNYVKWVIDWTAEGAKKTSLSPESIHYNGYDKGGREGNEQKARWDYASALALGVYLYSDLWPLLLQEKGDLPVRNLCYPVGRGTENMSVLLTDHEDTGKPYGRTDQLGYSKWITGVKLWPSTDRNLGSLAVRRGNGEYERYEATTYGEPSVLELGNDEYISCVEIWYGFKVGKVKLTTNKNRGIEAGNRHDSHYHDDHDREGHLTYAPDGYRLSYLASTQSSASHPTGTEGLVLGWWPLAIDVEHDPTPTPDPIKDGHPYRLWIEHSDRLLESPPGDTGPLQSGQPRPWLNDWFYFVSSPGGGYNMLVSGGGGSKTFYITDNSDYVRQSSHKADAATWYLESAGSGLFYVRHGSSPSGYLTVPPGGWIVTREKGAPNSQLWRLQDMG